MAFSSTITQQTVMGNMFVNMGTYTQGNGDTGGDIDTGLDQVLNFNATGSTNDVNSAGTVTITTADPGGDQTGYWMAIGY